ncbi:MAG: nucleotidyltransferase family protein [Actinobacteria bacterium]|nr:MAG: nucleotidyltransferase family protein [Actinomycetota bacterium]
MDKEDFEAEADRLLRAARAEGVTLRLLGALAFKRRCPVHARLQDVLKRVYTDIDFAAYSKEARKVQTLLSREGYVEDEMTYVESEGSRMVLNHPATGLHLDVFLDKLDFCHTVLWNGRLEQEEDTIPLAEMLMQKMQIVQLNEKDIVDTIMLLLEHPLGDRDGENINIELV